MKKTIHIPASSLCRVIPPGSQYLSDRRMAMKKRALILWAFDGGGKRFSPETHKRNLSLAVVIVGTHEEIKAIPRDFFLPADARGIRYQTGLSIRSLSTPPKRIR